MGLQGYLLDTCMIRYWFDTKHEKHVSVRTRIDSLPGDTPLRISAISVGEIEYGHRVVAGQYTPVQEELNRFIKERLPKVLAASESTALYYRRLRALLFDKFAPKQKRKGLRPEQLVHPVTSKELGIQENDLWLAAQAIEHRLVLVTHDKMDHIRQVLDAEMDLDIEDWGS